MKKKGVFVFVLISFLIVSVSFVSFTSAFSFSDFFNNLFGKSITGNAIANGRINGTVSFPETFTGITDIPYDGEMFNNKSFSISLRVKFNQDNTSGQIFGCGLSEQGYKIFIIERQEGNNKLRVSHWGDDVYDIISMPSGKWFYVVYTYNAVNRIEKIYVNNTLVMGQTLSNPLRINNTESNRGCFVGGWSSISPSINGTIDRLSIYNRELSANEVSSIYSLTNSAACTENWTCSSWGSCSNNQQTRTCTDNNNCGTTINKPITTQNCVSSVSSQQNCTDYEGAINYSIKGQIIKSGIVFFDSCLNSTNLQELFCSSSNEIAAIRYTCEFGCTEGRCADETEEGDINQEDYSSSDYNFSDYYYGDYNSSDYYDESGNNYSLDESNSDYSSSDYASSNEESSFNSSCISNWNCSYEPRNCPSSKKQTKRCMDLNGCRSDGEREVSCYHKPSSFSGASFMVKLICKLANLLDKDKYDSCIDEYISK